MRKEKEETSKYKLYIYSFGLLTGSSEHAVLVRCDIKPRIMAVFFIWRASSCGRFVTTVDLLYILLDSGHRIDLRQFFLQDELKL